VTIGDLFTLLLPVIILGSLGGVLDVGMDLVAAWRNRVRLRAARHLRLYLRGSGLGDSAQGRAALRARVWPGLVD
jgi:hypothetical protein